MINIKKTIIITGASSGLGRALAINYSLQDNIRLFLFGRSEQRLEEVANLCRKNGSEVNTVICQVEDKQAMQKNIEQIAQDFGINIIIACAGVSAGTLEGPESLQQVDKIFSTNLNGVINTIMPTIKPMIQMQASDRETQRSIVIISSMAGLIGLASSPAYSASKGAVKLFGDALRANLRKYKINVTVVVPGFIKTPMTDVNNFPMPFMLEADQAAKKIIKGIEQGKGIIAFPLITYFMLKLINLLPSDLITYINSKLPGKPALIDDELSK